MLVFDLETGPLPEEQLRELYEPLDESQVEGLVTGDFDPSVVKVGNLKDQAKIAEKIEAARQAHETAKANASKIIAEAREQHWNQFVGRAALSPITGRILVIGYYATEKNVTLVSQKPEPDLLTEFWQKYEECRTAGRKMVGHNIGGFDIPFLVRRSWLLDIPVPATVFDRGKWLDSDTLVDTLRLWKCGTNDGEPLDSLGRAFGLGGKTEGVNGGDFHRLWFGSEQDRAKAIEYATRDVVLTGQIAIRMGVV